jgi:23S rRNA pseudouridine1911/1915/1917 synthase
MRPVTVKNFSFTVAPDDAGLRLDQLLAKRVPGLSRRTARKVVLIGGVFVERARVKIGSKIIQPGRKVEVNLGGALEVVTAAEKAAPPEIDILFEDDGLLVADKPSGLATAATRETDRHNLLYYLSQRPSSPDLHLVHRLDLETSGLLVFAKTAETARVLSELFRAHDLERSYRVAMLGRLDAEQIVEEPVEGRPAHTTFVPVEHKGDITLADARLGTGRTHQIRVHAQHLGKPVLGDRRYGQSVPQNPPRMALHARVLAFRHPTTGAPMRFEREWPADLQGWWETLGPCPKS